MGKHSTVKILLVLVVLGGLIFYLNDQGLLSQANITLPSGQPQDGTQTFTGTLTQQLSFFNSADNTEYGEDTETDSVIYKKLSDGTYATLAVPDQTGTHPNTASVPIDSDTLTYYIETEITSGQAFYVDIEKTKASNPRIGTPFWDDLNANGRKTWVMPVDATGYNADPNTTPTQTATIFLIAEGSITVDSPADVDITDTGKQRCNVKWSADMGSSGQGEFVTRVRLTFNSTDTTDWFTTDSNISFPTGSDPNSGKQKIFLTEFKETQLASTFQYDWIVGTDYNDAKLLLSPNNGEQQFEIPFEIWVNMDSVASALQGTLEIQTINAQGAHTASSDAVLCT